MKGLKSDSKKGGKEKQKRKEWGQRIVCLRKGRG